MIGNISKSKGFKGDRGYQGVQGERGEPGVQGERGFPPDVRFEYNQETGDLYYESDDILLETDYAAGKEFATKQFVIDKLLEYANKVAPTPAMITLYADRWVKNEGETRYHQELIFESGTVTQYSQIKLHLSVEQVDEFIDKKLAFMVENDSGVITAYCMGELPDQDYVIRATISEVLVNVE